MLKSEGREHSQLKVRAVAFLQSIGCQDIQCEYRWPKIQYTLGIRPRHWRTKQSFLFDVVGFRRGGLIVVECGGILASKLKGISNQHITLYILPRGRKIPYLWQPNTAVCRVCGHKVS